MKQLKTTQPFFQMVLLGFLGGLTGIFAGLILSLILNGILALIGDGGAEIPPATLVSMLGMGSGAIIGGVLGGIVGIRGEKK